MAMPIPATATVARGQERRDIAVPPGTTVAGLLAMLHLDTTGEVVVARADGRPVALSASIGGDLPSGVLLALTDPDAVVAARARADAGRGAGFAAPLASIVTLMFALAVEVGVLVIPLARPTAGIPDGARWLGAVVSAGVVLALALRTRLGTTVGGALAGPGLLGAPASALADPASPTATTVALGLALVGATLAGFAIWLVRGDAPAAASAIAWGATALLVCAGLAAGATPANLAPVLLGLGVGAVLLAPRHALPVPESQLLDLPLLTTSAPAVRAAEVASPSRVTRRRMGHTLGWARAVTETTTVAGSVLAAASGFVMALRVDLGTLSGKTGLASLAAAVLALALLPRGQRSRVVRTLPRVAATGLAAGAAAALVGRGLVAGTEVVAALVGLALVLVWGAVLATREPRSALLSRLADLVQGLALVLVVPTAFVASGLFDLVRQVAS